MEDFVLDNICIMDDIDCELQTSSDKKLYRILYDTRNDRNPLYSDIAQEIYNANGYVHLDGWIYRVIDILDKHENPVKEIRLRRLMKVEDL